jgi:peptidoglycan/xylan/chitin deacetylase (PgdA/CDA1 family)
MKNLRLSVIVLALFTLVSCTNTAKDDKQSETKQPEKTDSSSTAKIDSIPTTIADAATILARKEVPVLCYHQVRDWKASDSKSARDIIVPVEVFKSHMKILADSGYHTILPDQLYSYLAAGTPLPEKPVMLTFDDTDVDQYTVAWPEMKKYGFKGVFFIMTVSINRRPRYMTKEEIKELADAGNVVESHTWNHERVPSYTTPEKWDEQILGPIKKIEEITGQKSKYFAYPFGLWKKEGIPELKKRGIKAAYILSTKRDPDDPLYTIRRMIGSGYWSAEGLYSSMLSTFNKPTVQ